MKQTNKQTSLFSFSFYLSIHQSHLSKEAVQQYSLFRVPCHHVVYPVLTMPKHQRRVTFALEVTQEGVASGRLAAHRVPPKDHDPGLVQTLHRPLVGRCRCEHALLLLDRGFAVLWENRRL